MALAGEPAGIQFEVVAPLRADAPCVGALTRDGEGPYHCCWRVPDTAAMLDMMRHCGVKHTVIRQDGHSGLFPEEHMTFVLVAGFGLIEFLDGSEPDVAGIGPYGGATDICVRVQSSDLANARRFLLQMGYTPCSSPDGDGTLPEIWRTGDQGHTIALAQATASVAACFTHIDLGSPGISSMAGLNPPTEVHCSEMSTTWWNRVRPLRWIPEVEDRLSP